MWTMLGTASIGTSPGLPRPGLRSKKSALPIVLTKMSPAVLARAPRKRHWRAVPLGMSSTRVTIPIARSDIAAALPS
jgi:hypothetical protein